MKLIKLSFILSLILAIIFMSGCGQKTFTKVRFTSTPYSKDGDEQTKQDIIIKRYEIKNTPDELIARVPKCDKKTNMNLLDSKGKHVMETALVIPRGCWIEKIGITNNTGHIIRLDNITAVLFDPAGNPYNVLTKEETESYIRVQRPCPGSQYLIDRLNIIKFITPRKELLPDITTTGYLLFKPQKTAIQGAWKLSLYNVPCKTDNTGKVIKSVDFDFISIIKKYKDTYTQEGYLKKPVKISSQEIK